MPDYAARSLELHKTHAGKIATALKVPIENKDDLSTAYTPGVAEPCRVIAKDAALAYDYTIKGNAVAVVTDGSAVLGLGNIGPAAALPVMEGKAAIFKRFAGIDAYPICLATQNTEEIIQTVKNIAPGFGGINLEDIAAPRCFEIERRLQAELDIPVIHDDQHGTGVVVLAGLLNALKVVGKRLEEVQIVVSGSGAAGMGIAHLLLAAGVQHLSLLDSKGIIAPGRTDMNGEKQNMAERINPQGHTGTLADALKSADVFIGVSQPKLVTAEMIRSMNTQPIVFAMANPTPEILPEEALAAGAAIAASGRSDYPNQVNNSLVFPGMFLGLLEARAKQFTVEMKLAAAHALAATVPHPMAARILPTVFEIDTARAIAEGIKSAIKNRAS